AEAFQNRHHGGSLSARRHGSLGCRGCLRLDLLDQVEATVDVAERESTELGEFEFPPLHAQQPLDDLLRKPVADDGGGNATDDGVRRTSLVTTDPAAITAPSPTFTPAVTLTLCPVHTSLPMVTCLNMSGVRSSRTKSLYSSTQSNDLG